MGLEKRERTQLSQPCPQPRCVCVGVCVLHSCFSQCLLRAEHVNYIENVFNAVLYHLQLSQSWDKHQYTTIDCVQSESVCVCVLLTVM